jgi:hypothetical protein
MSSLGVDKCIDHTKEKWTDVPEWKSHPFDVIFDCAEGVSAWHACLEKRMLKPASEGGRWVSVVLTEWHIEIVHTHQICTFFCPVLGRLAKNSLGRAVTGGKSAPTYMFHMGGVRATLARL